MRGALANSMRVQAMRAMAAQASSRVGLVRSYDPANFAVRVELQPEGILSGWLPVTSPWIGNGWGMMAGPALGDMVAVHFFGADLEAGHVEGRMFNDIDRALAVPSGELWLVHASGAFFKLTNDGKATFDDGHGARVTLNGDGTISSAGAWSHTGNVTVSGTVNASGNITSAAQVQGNVVTDATGTMGAMRTAYNAHKGHGAPGTGNTPDHSM